MSGHLAHALIWAEETGTSSAVWAALLTLIVTNLAQLAKQWMDGRDRKLEADRVEAAAKAAATAAKEVKTTLDTSTKAAAEKAEEVRDTLVATADKAAKRMDDMVSSIEVIHKATNSIKDELVASARSEGLLQGAKDEADRQERAAKEGGT